MKKTKVSRIEFCYENFMNRDINEEVIFYDVNIDYFKLENCGRDATKLEGADFVNPYYILSEGLVDIDQPTQYMAIEINGEFAGYAIYDITQVKDGRPTIFLYFLEIFPLARGRNLGLLLQEELLTKLSPAKKRVLLVDGAWDNQEYWELMKSRSGPEVEVIFEGM